MALSRIGIIWISDIFLIKIQQNRGHCFLQKTVTWRGKQKMMTWDYLCYVKVALRCHFPESQARSFNPNIRISLIKKA